MRREQGSNFSDTDPRGKGLCIGVRETIVVDANTEV